MQVMPRAWARRVPPGIGLNLRCLEEGGGGVAVRAGRRGWGRESGLEDRERGVPSLLDRSGRLGPLVREVDCARHDLLRLSGSRLSVLLGEVE